MQTPKKSPIASGWFINNELHQIGLRHGGQGRKKYNFDSYTYTEQFKSIFIQEHPV